MAHEIYNNNKYFETNKGRKFGNKKVASMEYLKVFRIVCMVTLVNQLISKSVSQFSVGSHKKARPSLYCAKRSS